MYRVTTLLLRGTALSVCVWECSLYAIKVQSHPSVFLLNVESNDAYKIESPMASAARKKKKPSFSTISSNLEQAQFDFKR